MLRKALKSAMSLMPETVQGTMEYWLRPSLAAGFGALNGQQIREEIFRRVFERFSIGQIVETGTFRGTTTEFFAQTQLPVHSIEVSPKLYRYARWRLRSLKNVHLYQGSSVSQLPNICRQLAAEANPTFVYLDAHWQEYLPLGDELRILSKFLRKSIIMIDDFEVPGDPGYGFDDYGPGKRISIEIFDYPKIISPVFVFFPVLPSVRETGRRRGTCVVAFDTEIGAQLKTIDLLQIHSVR